MPRPGFAVGFEILFGDHPSITRRHPSWEQIDERVREAAERARQRAEEEAADSENTDGEGQTDEKGGSGLPLPSGRGPG